MRGQDNQLQEADHAVPVRLADLRELQDQQTVGYWETAKNISRINVNVLGIGMQLTSTAVDPDRACKVACQDRDFSYR